VEGLAEPILIDPFADEIFGNGKTVNVLLEGTDPFINLYMNNCAAANDPVRHIVYQYDKSWNLQNGDVITITASLDKRFQNQGYLLTRTETTIIVDGFDRHASAVSDLTQEVLAAMSDRAYQECVNGGSVDIYDGNNNLWPWGARFENIHVGDTALLAVNHEIDAEYSFLLVPVYKTITTDTWYDMDAATNITQTWENVVGYYKFSDVVVHPDGSVTFYEDYVAMNGNYTDAEVADALYLNELRANYSLLEVPMP
jgi:hypothetical protein